MAASSYIPPEEVLVDIFWTRLDDEPIGSYHEARTTLILVSRGWNTIIQHAPPLWARISSLCSPHMNALSLMRSKNAPLEIYFPMKGLIPSKQPDATKSFILACQHLPRWRTADLSFGTNFSNQLRRLLSNPAPWLEEVYVDLHQTSEHFLDIFGGQADRLESVSLRGVCIPWANGMLSGLEILDLGYTLPDPPSLNHILSIISSSPRLSVLNLGGIDFVGQESLEHPIVPAPHLHTLLLSPNRYQSIEHLLRHVIVPTLMSLSLHTFLTNITAAPSFINIIPSVALPIDSRMELKIGTSSISYTCLSGEEQSLVISLGRVRTTLIISPFIDYLGPDLRALHTRLILKDLRIEDPADISQFLVAINSIQVAELALHSGSLGDATLERLANRPWIFPSLQRLSIDVKGITPSLLSRMVLARHGIHPSAEGADLPLPFTKIRVFKDKSNPHTADRQILDLVLDGGVLEWGVQDRENW